MQKLHCFLLIVFLSTFISCTKDTKSFTNSIYNYSIAYPIQWDLQNNNNDVVIIRSPKTDSDDLFQENCTIVVEQLEGQSKPFLNDIINSLNDQVKRLKVDLKKEIIINNISMEMSEFSYSFGSLDIVARAYVFTHNNFLYKCFFTAQKKDISKVDTQFNSIIKSFVVK